HLHWLSRQSSILPVGAASSASQFAVANARLPHVEVEQAESFECLRARPGTFVGISYLDVLGRIPDHDAYLARVKAARAALRPGGFFAYRVPDAANLAGSYSRYVDFTHVRSSTRTSLLQLLEAAGLDDYRVAPIRAFHPGGRARLSIEH